MKVFGVEYVILPFEQLVKNERIQPITQFMQRDLGLDIYTLVEMILICRNRVENRRLQALGITTTARATIEDELSWIHFNDRIAHLDPIHREQITDAIESLALDIYGHLAGLFEAPLTEGDGPDVNLVFERWLQDDLVISFSAN